MLGCGKCEGKCGGGAGHVGKCGKVCWGVRGR